MGDEKPMSASTGAIKKKKEDKIRRRDQRSWDNVIKSCNNVSESEKLSVIQGKYTDLLNELRKVSSSLQLLERQTVVLQRERDHTQTELTKNILAKSKLEGLCRELQKQNKIIKDDNITRVKEEEERRREVAASFTEKLNVLTALMDENKDKSVRLREENMSMTTKLTELYDQFQEREGHLANMNRQLELQKKLSETQIKKLEVEYQSERQVWDQERQMLLENLAKCDESNATLQANVNSLQEHLDIYRSQYSDFETTMQKSNKVFDAFKEEMAKMQKANALLEKERNDYRTRWQTCTNSVVQVSEMQQQTAGELNLCERKVLMLEKLCRQLQAERTAYLQQLEENKIKPVAAPVQEERPLVERPPTGGSSGGSIPSAAQRRLTKKEKLLVALKSELKVMEDELKRNMSTKERELAALKKDLKVVVEQRKIASQQPQPSTSKEAMESLEMQEPGAVQDQQAMEQPSTITLYEQSTSDLESFISDPATSTTTFSSAPSATNLPLKKVQSCPLMQKEPKEVDPDESSSSSTSLEELMADLSLDAIPLYKPEGVTDFTNQPETGPLVVEAAAHTNLLEAVPSGTTVSATDVQDATASETEGTGTEGTETESTDAGTSAGSIPLKDVEGKTEIKKEA